MLPLLAWPPKAGETLANRSPTAAGSKNVLGMAIILIIGSWSAMRFTHLGRP